MFRRRRDAGEAKHQVRTGKHERRGLDPELDDDFTGDSEEEQAPAGRGPWDSREAYPERLRIDVGSLLVPAAEGQDVGLELSDDQSQFVAVSVDVPDGKLQVRALAAPKTGGLWEDERIGIVQTISKAGGQARETDGPFGPEVAVLEPPHPDSGLTGLQPARFIGVDGPRWLLIGKISGPAAVRPEQATRLEDAFADIVVVRGDHPAAPRDVLQILLPAEMREALAQQMAETEAQQQQQQQQGQFLVPTERGPEITETR